MAEIISDYTPPSDAGQNGSLLDGPAVLRKNQDYIRSSHEKDLGLDEGTSNEGMEGTNSLPISVVTESSMDLPESAIAGDTYDSPENGTLYDSAIPGVQTTGEVTLSKRERKRLARAALEGTSSSDTQPVYGRGKYGRKNAAAAHMRAIVDEKITKYQEGYRNGIKSKRRGGKK